MDNYSHMDSHLRTENETYKFESNIYLLMIFFIINDYRIVSSRESKTISFERMKIEGCEKDFIRGMSVK